MIKKNERKEKKIVRKTNFTGVVKEIKRNNFTTYVIPRLFLFAASICFTQFNLIASDII